MTRPAIAVLASGNPKARAARDELVSRYGAVEAADADVLIVLGGDGFMLHTLHEHADRGQRLFGMRLGDVGFLMNRYSVEGLFERLEAAEEVGLNPLRMIAETTGGGRSQALAINEVSLLRQTNQAAHIRIEINDRPRVEKLVADGVLVCTAAGSTAYNLSAHGPILPLGTEALALTPISPFRPRRWRGAVLPAGARITLRVLNADHRPVSATADYDEFRNVSVVHIRQDKSVVHRLLFDPEHSLEERILNEQFI